MFFLISLALSGVSFAQTGEQVDEMMNVWSKAKPYDVRLFKTFCDFKMTEKWCTMFAKEPRYLQQIGNVIETIPNLALSFGLPALDSFDYKFLHDEPAAIETANAWKGQIHFTFDLGVEYANDSERDDAIERIGRACSCIDQFRPKSKKALITFRLDKKAREYAVKMGKDGRTLVTVPAYGSVNPSVLQEGFRAVP